MSLPKLTWDLDPVLFFLPLPGGALHGIRYYGVLFWLLLVGGYALFDWQVQRAGGNKKNAAVLIWYVVVGVFVGARLGHMLFYEFDKTLADPLSVLRIWSGGLASHGAAAGVLLAVYLFTRRRGVPFLEGLDRLAFSAALAVPMVRVGNFLNSEIVGRATDQTWGVRFLRYSSDKSADLVPYRHPAQLYEAALGVAILVALLVADRAWHKEARPRGALIALAATAYFGGRFFLEFFKEYQTLSPGSWLTMGQWLSLPCALFAIWLLRRSLRQRVPAGWPERAWT